MSLFKVPWHRAPVFGSWQDRRSEYATLAHHLPRPPWWSVWIMFKYHTAAVMIGNTKRDCLRSKVDKNPIPWRKPELLCYRQAILRNKRWRIRNLAKCLRENTTPQTGWSQRKTEIGRESSHSLLEVYWNYKRSPAKENFQSQVRGDAPACRRITGSLWAFADMDKNKGKKPSK